MIFPCPDLFGTLAMLCYPHSKGQAAERDDNDDDDGEQVLRIHLPFADERRIEIFSYAFQFFRHYIFCTSRFSRLLFHFGCRCVCAANQFSKYNYDF